MRPWRVPYPKFGKGAGLERVGKIAAALGVDLSAFGAQGAVIVGSNGKGSTAAMTAALLQASGAEVGLFTSPHLFDLNERFRVDGEDITDEALAYRWGRVAEAVERAGEADNLGGFEFLFLIAADWFAACGCTHTVWEAGIGGRLDPVRLIHAGRVALTSLDLEHTELLGATLEEIARDKIDAAPQGASLFVSESCRAQREAISFHCAARALNCVFVPETADDLALPLTGAFQRQNAALALQLARDLLTLSDSQARTGFAETRWPGRLEVIEEEPLIVIDVGHTPEGVRAALAGFESLRADRRGLLVCGASHDKDVAEIVGALAPAFGLIICASASHKGVPAAKIAVEARAANPDAEIVIAESVAEAHRLALSRTRGGAGYVAGSLFLAAEFKAVHIGRDPASLAFF